MSSGTEPRSRCQIEESDTTLRFIIPYKRNWFVIGFLGLWLLFWGYSFCSGLVVLVAFGGIAVSGLVTQEAMSTMTMMIVVPLFMTLVTIVIVVIPLYMFLLVISGREEITFQLDTITIRHTMMRLGKRQKYPIEQCSNLHIVQSSDDIKAAKAPLLWSGVRMTDATQGCIVFDCNGQAIRFGIAITDVEAQQIVSKIERRYPHLKAK